MMRIRYSALVALAIALAELALLPVLLDIGGKQIGTITQLFYAFMIGSAVSLSASYVKDRMQGIRNIIRSNHLLVVIIIAGLLNDVVSQLLLGIGSVGTNPVIAATVFRSWVIIAALLVPITLRQRVKKIQLLALAIGFIGIYILASGGTLLDINLATLPFIIILLGSALSSVYPNLAMKRYNVDVVGAVGLFNVSSFIFMIALVLFTNTSISIPINYSVVLPILFLGTATYGVGTTLYYYALKAFGPLYVGNSILLVPFLTIILSVMILGTPIYWYYIVAALLLSAGVLLQQRAAGAPEHISSEKLAGRVIFDITGAFINNKDPVIARYLHGNKKALALRVGDDFKLDGKAYKLFGELGCFVCSTRSAGNILDRKELEFMREMMGTTDSDAVIIGIGDAGMLDRAFSELLKQ